MRGYETDIFKIHNIPEPDSLVYAKFGFKLAKHRNAVRENSEAVIREFGDRLDSHFIYLICNHDMSKFIEPERTAYAFKYCWPKEEMAEEIKDFIKFGWIHHIAGNSHHPEHWRLKGNINLMPFESLAEMACDIGSFQRMDPAECDVLEWWAKEKEKYADFDWAHLSDLQNMLEAISLDIEKIR
jgi:hypothetical protein